MIGRLVNLSRVALEIIPRVGALLAFGEVLPLFYSEILSLSAIYRLVDNILQFSLLEIIISATLIGYIATGLISIALGSPISFILALLFKLLSLRGDISLLSNASILAGLVLVFMSTVIRLGYRPNQGVSLRFRGSKTYTAVSTLIVVFFVFSVAIYGSFYIASFITAYNIEVANIYLKPLMDFLFVNPIGRFIVISVFIIYIYTALRNLGSAIALYTSPSRKLAVSELSIAGELDSSYAVPFKFMLSLAFSALVSPPLFYIARRSLSLVNIDLSSVSQAIYSYTGFNISASAVEGGLALLIFMVFWMLYPRLFRSVVGRGLVAEGSGRSIVVLALTIVIVYGASYYMGLVSSDNPLELRGLDEHVSSIALSFYTYIYSFLEIFPQLLGFAP